MPVNNCFAGSRRLIDGTRVTLTPAMAAAGRRIRERDYRLEGPSRRSRDAGWDCLVWTAQDRGRHFVHGQGGAHGVGQVRPARAPGWHHISIWRPSAQAIRRLPERGAWRVGVVGHMVLTLVRQSANRITSASDRRGGARTPRRCRFHEIVRCTVLHGIVANRNGAPDRTNFEFFGRHFDRLEHRP